MAPTTDKPKRRRRGTRRKGMTAAERIASDAPDVPVDRHRKSHPRRRVVVGRREWDVFQRLLLIEQLMAGGATDREITKWCAETQTDPTTGKVTKAWTVTPGTAREYMARVRAYRKEESADQQDTWRDEVRSTIRLAIKTAIQRGKMSAIPQLVHIRCQLDGLYEPQRLNVVVSQPATQEEFAERVTHYRSTLELIEAEGLTNGAGAPGNGTAQPTRH